ncbi:HTH_Tnp_Tc3_2 domain-containing protein, partial [Trichonephila clavipes]
RPPSCNAEWGPTCIWQLLRKRTTDGAHHQTCLASSLQLPVRQPTKADRVHDARGTYGLYARRPVRCVSLTSTHCRLRLTWSREHALSTPQQWSCVMFSDESMFSLQPDSGRTLAMGERQVPVTTQENNYH